jgi:adenine phosphoribosyltransferase
VSADYIKSVVKAVPDYPKPGIMFRDVTAVIEDHQAFSGSVALLAENYAPFNFDKIASTEARGFFFGAPLALQLGIGFIPVRKSNKLPRETISESYELEYGKDTLEIHKDSIKAGEKVLMIDDLLATGGTMVATAKLIRRLGGIADHAGFVIGLPDLGGVEKLAEIGIKSHTICDFDGD